MPAPGAVHGGGQAPVALGQALVPLFVAAQFGPVALGLRGEFGGVPVREPLLGAPVAEGEDGAGHPVALADRCDGHVDEQPGALPVPQGLPPDAVGTAGPQGVGEGRLLVRERLAVRP